MTYLQFLLIFLCVPLLFVYIIFKKSELPNKKEFRLGILLLILLSVSYTTPWDNYLVKTGVWIYGEDRILGTIGYVPIEEYCFFILQTILSGLCCFLLQKRYSLKRGGPDPSLKHIVSICYGGLFLVGLGCLYFERTRYLGLILSWALPVLLLQWIIGGGHLLRNFKIFLASALIPTFYLWIADALALSWGIWSISETYTIGVKVGSLPLEEAIFFLLTNLMIAQGLILFAVMSEEVAKVSSAKRRILEWVGWSG